jgi:rubrerythrin
VGHATRIAIVLAVVSLLLALSGCGGGHGAETDPEKGADAAILNSAMSHELTLLDAYSRGRRYMRGSERDLIRRLRAEEGEFVDDLTKAIRGLGGESEGETEELDPSKAKSRAGFLLLVTELETEAREFYVGEAARLNTSAPRTLDAWLAAGHGQHLGMLAPGGG